MYPNIEAIIEANKKVGQHFFESGTMQFFSSRVEPGVYHGYYFITSEQYEATPTAKDKGAQDGPRLWTLHLCSPDGWVSTVGDFQMYTTLEEAMEAAKLLPPPEWVSA